MSWQNRELPDHCRVIYEEVDELDIKDFLPKKTFLERKKRKRYLKNHRLKGFKKKVKGQKTVYTNPDNWWAKLCTKYKYISSAPIDVSIATCSNKSTYKPLKKYYESILLGSTVVTPSSLSVEKAMNYYMDPSEIFKMPKVVFK